MPKNPRKRKQRHNYPNGDDQQEVIPSLPATISRIEVQKKNNTRFSLFSGDDFLFGVSDHTLTKFDIRKGMVISSSLYQKIRDSEDYWAAREFFLRLLSRRDHSAKELKQKAQKKGLNTANVDDLLCELEQKGYIDHRTFARRYTRDKLKLNKWGPFKIRTSLLQKGISSNLIDMVLSEISDDQKKEQMIQLVEKNTLKFRRADPKKRKKKIFDFLLRKGYDSNNILSYMEQLLGIIEE